MIFSPFFVVTPTHTFTRTHAHTHTLSLSLSLLFSHTHKHTRIRGKYFRVHVIRGPNKDEGFATPSSGVCASECVCVCVCVCELQKHSEEQSAMLGAVLHSQQSALLPSFGLTNGWT